MSVLDPSQWTESAIPNSPVNCFKSSRSSCPVSLPSIRNFVLGRLASSSEQRRVPLIVVEVGDFYDDSVFGGQAQRPAIEPYQLEM